MPWTENDNFLCGCAMKKNESGTWIRRFLVLDFSGRVLKLYREDVEVSAARRLYESLSLNIHLGG